MASADSLRFLLHHEEGPKWTEAQGFREEIDNPERKGRSREEGEEQRGTGGADRDGSVGAWEGCDGKGVWHTQAALLSREAPEVPVLARPLRQAPRSVTRTTLLGLPGLLWLLPGLGKGVGSGELMPGATVLQRH